MIYLWPHTMRRHSGRLGDDRHQHYSRISILRSTLGENPVFGRNCIWRVLMVVFMT